MNEQATTNDSSIDGAASALDDGLGDLVDALRAENATLRNAQKACEHCGPNSARWQDGEPANLEAAAADAYEWLKYLQARGMKLYMSTDEWNKLDSCMIALHAFMTQTPNLNSTTPDVA